MKKKYLNVLISFFYYTVAMSQDVATFNPFEIKKEKIIKSYSTNFFEFSGFNKFDTYLRDSVMFNKKIVFYSITLSKNKNKKIEFFKNDIGYNFRKYDDDGVLVEQAHCVISENVETKIDTIWKYEPFGNTILDTNFKENNEYKLIYDGTIKLIKDKNYSVFGYYSNNKKQGNWSYYYANSVIQKPESGFLQCKSEVYFNDTLIYTDTINKILNTNYNLEEELKKRWEYLKWADFKIENKKCFVLTSEESFCGNFGGFNISFDGNHSLKINRNNIISNNMNFLRCTKWKVENKNLKLYGNGNHEFEVIYLSKNSLVLKQTK